MFANPCARSRYAQAAAECSAHRSSSANRPAQRAALYAALPKARRCRRGPRLQASTRGGGPGQHLLPARPPIYAAWSTPRRAEEQAQAAETTNPRLSICYSGEDYMKHCKNLIVVKNGSKNVLRFVAMLRCIWNILCLVDLKWCMHIIKSKNVVH